MATKNTKPAATNNESVNVREIVAEAIAKRSNRPAFVLKRGTKIKFASDEFKRVPAEFRALAFRRVVGEFCTRSSVHLTSLVLATKQNKPVAISKVETKRALALINWAIDEFLDEAISKKFIKKPAKPAASKKEDSSVEFFRNLFAKAKYASNRNGSKDVLIRLNRTTEARLRELLKR